MNISTPEQIRQACRAAARISRAVIVEEKLRGRDFPMSASTLPSAPGEGSAVVGSGDSLPKPPAGAHPGAIGHAVLIYLTLSMAQRRIDSHHHFWYFNDAEYPWIGQRPALRRNFAPADLERELKAAGIDAAVSVQARQTVGETEWLLDFAEKNSFLAGVVGWAPLTSPGAGKILDGLARRKKLKGIRHGLQGESDNNYALRTDFQNGVKALLPHKLVYDILILEKQLPAAIQLVTNHPQQVFVLDHIAKPRIKEGLLSPWRENMRELAKRPNVTCKLSGIATEADPKNWTLEQITPYLDVALESFGPRRLMFGSDWPVALQATSYVKWADTVQSYISKLSAAEQDRIMGGTAIETYRL